MISSSETAHLAPSPGTPLFGAQWRLERQFRHSQDAVHRGADFVADIRQELALRFIGCFGRLLGLQ